MGWNPKSRQDLDESAGGSERSIAETAVAHLRCAPRLAAPQWASAQSLLGNLYSGRVSTGITKFHTDPYTSRTCISSHQHQLEHTLVSIIVRVSDLDKDVVICDLE